MEDEQPQGESNGALCDEEIPSESSEVVPVPIIDSREPASSFDRKGFMNYILEHIPASDRGRIEKFISRPNWSESSTNLEHSFRAFAREEASISGRNVQHLVRPSGSVSSPLAIRLHYPTFTV